MHWKGKGPQLCVNDGSFTRVLSKNGDRNGSLFRGDRNLFS